MMLADIRVAYLQIIGAISLLPNWIASLAYAAAAILAALLAYALIVRIVRRTLGARHPYLRSLLARTKGTFLIAPSRISRGLLEPARKPWTAARRVAPNHQRMH